MVVRTAHFIPEHLHMPVATC